MQRSTPFARSIAMMAALASAMALGPAAQAAAMDQIGPYVSRGKGRHKGAIGLAAKARHLCRSKYKPHQGAGEVARRQRQIAKGMLRPVARA